jgi:hypothetical protein
MLKPDARSAPRPRGAHTLVELITVLVFGAIVLGLASRTGVRLQRHLRAEADRSAAAAQLAAGVEVLPIDLRALSPNAGDIVASGARDTSLEVRATIANAVVCGAGPRTLTLAFHLGPNGRAPTPHAAPGDTAWVFVDADSGERWRPIAIAKLERTPGTCSPLGAGSNQVFDASHIWTAERADDSSVPPASIVRLTRKERFSFYRAGDGQWYLGLRTWNGALGQFNGVQPVSGPYRSPLRPHGVRFRYFDGSGREVASGSENTRAIARVEIVFAVDRPDEHASSGVDSLTVVVALRNRV